MFLFIFMLQWDTKSNEIYFNFEIKISVWMFMSIQPYKLGWKAVLKLNYNFKLLSFGAWGYNRLNSRTDCVSVRLCDEDT